MVEEEQNHNETVDDHQARLAAVEVVEADLQSGPTYGSMVQLECHSAVSAASVAVSVRPDSREVELTLRSLLFSRAAQAVKVVGLRALGRLVLLEIADAQRREALWRKHHSGRPRSLSRKIYPNSLPN
jgi:hypothetical protein